MVVVRSLNDGGIYALEIESDLTLAVVSKGAQEWEEQREEGSDEEGTNALLRSRGFLGSTDAGGNTLKLKEPKLQGMTTPKLQQPISSSSSGVAEKRARVAAAAAAASNTDSMEACKDVAPPWRKDLCLVGSHKLSSTWNEGGLAEAASSPISPQVDGEVAVSSFDSAAEFDKFLLSVEEAQLEEQRREQELYELRRESMVSWRKGLCG